MSFELERYKVSGNLPHFSGTLSVPLEKKKAAQAPGASNKQNVCFQCLVPSIVILQMFAALYLLFRTSVIYSFLVPLMSTSAHKIGVKFVAVCRPIIQK